VGGLSFGGMDCNQQAGDADLAAIGAALGEPARAKILLALVDGRSLAASHLATESGVSPPTASHHLSRLRDAGLITATSRGRHRYYALANEHVAELIESAARLAPPRPITSLRQGTRAFAVRYARRCFDHLAGRLGVALADALSGAGVVVIDHGSGSNGSPRRGSRELAPEPLVFGVTEQGAGTLSRLGIGGEQGEVARGCLDWSEQRHHIAGPLGRRLMAHFLELDWVRLDRRSRAVRVTDAGRSGLHEGLGVEVPEP
jgi:DNA-binding transcriptional ArsR family regulator